ncbi:MAG: hypothetical protein IJ775_06290 [Muribaculaceae bacterium]|nr:hypothetical protein [Muribaculaceae bacterium]
MKKYLFISSALAILLSSCASQNLIRKSATTQRSESDIRSVTVADLDVYPERVTYSMAPTKEIARGGEENVKRAAEAAVLQKYGNADVMVDAQYIVKKENSTITSITVTGHPAHYKNFHSVPDSVWEYAITTMKATTSQQNSESESSNSLFNLIPKPNISLSGARFEAYFNALGGYRFDGDFEKGSFYAGGTLSLGCRLMQNVFVGVGAGGYYMFEPEIIYVPVFGNARYYFTQSNVSPFIDLKAGYSFLPQDKNTSDGGLFLSPTLGYSFNHFELGLNYTMQKTKPQYGNKVTEHMVGLSLGIRF